MPGQPSTAVVRPDRPATALYPPGAVLAWRILEDHELVWMLRGSARLTTGDGSVCDLRPGELALVPPGVSHRFDWDERRTSAHGHVHFEVLQGATPSLTGPRVLALEPGDLATSACTRLLEVAGRGGGAAAVIAALVTVLLDLFDDVAAATPVDLPPAAVSAAIAYLHVYWADMPLERVDVATMARACALSPAQLTRVFTGWFGVGPRSVLESLRLSRAEQLLLRTDLSVDAVARSTGFADAAHLTHRLRAVHGATPGTIRRRMRGVGVTGRVAEFARAVWR